MNAPDTSTDVSLPRPIVKHRWPSYLIWIVPVIAIVAAGFYAQRWLSQRGPTVIIHVVDATMIEPGNTQVRCHGVEIGEIGKVTLADDHSGALVYVTLRRQAESFAKTGTLFWIVKPDISTGSISNLGTVFSGPYFEAISGDGAMTTDFNALPSPPTSQADGLKIELFAEKMNHVAAGTSIYYRGVEVGTVDGSQLAPDATHVTFKATILRRYAPLVRQNSAFWFEAPADVKGGIFSGLEVKLGSIKSLLSGGINFATPNTPFQPPAIDGAAFALLGDAPKEAETWRPQIAITPDDTTQPAQVDKHEATIGVK